MADNAGKKTFRVAVFPENEHCMGISEQTVPEYESGKFWYLIRSGVVVTIAVGLFAILLGTIVLLAAWRREERRKKRK